MNKQNKQPTVETFKIPETGSKENPVLFGDSPDELRGLYFSVESEQGEAVDTFGSYEGYYMKDDGVRADIVSHGSGDVLEVVDGKAVRSLAGGFLSGEAVSVLRSDGSVEDDWSVYESKDTKSGRRTAVVKISDAGEMLTKVISTQKLRQFNPSDVALPEQLTAPEKGEALTDQQHALASQALRSLVEVS